VEPTHLAHVQMVSTMMERIKFVNHATTHVKLALEGIQLTIVPHVKLPLIKD